MAGVAAIRRSKKKEKDLSFRGSGPKRARALFLRRMLIPMEAMITVAAGR